MGEGRGFRDAAEFGFSPEASGLTNAEALQEAVSNGGTIQVTRPGVYSIARTVLLPSYTNLIFGNSVFLKKSDEEGPFTHVFSTRGL